MVFAVSDAIIRFALEYHCFSNGDPLLAIRSVSVGMPAASFNAKAPVGGVHIAPTEKKRVSERGKRSEKERKRGKKMQRKGEAENNGKIKIVASQRL